MNARRGKSGAGGGKKTRGILEDLRRYESRNITFQDPDGSWPIVWRRARGTRVWDEEGKEYLDLTAAFGVAASGHANPRVVRAGQRQLAELPHAMGDVHPHALKASLACELSRLTFERWSQGQPAAAARHGKTIFCSSGFEAVESAMKTALRATGRSGILAFEGAYHGVGYGALNATHRPHFRESFRSQLREFGTFLPFPTEEEAHVRIQAIEKQIEKRLSEDRPGAVLLEPIQARGGIRVPPRGFLRRLSRLCARYGALLIFDEIYTGFGRTGRWFACEHEGVIPDLICLGKALAGGFPISACVGRSDLMDEAWPESEGEAIHTSTFLGNPVGCAMALAQIQELRRRDLPARSESMGAFFSEQIQAVAKGCQSLDASVRGRGLMLGLELRRHDGSPATSESLALVKKMLHCGFIVLPEGSFSEVLGFTPPLTITVAELRRTTRVLKSLLT